MQQVVTKGAVRNVRINLPFYTPKGFLGRGGQDLKDQPLAVREVMSHPKRSDITTRQKTNTDSSGLLKKLWGGMASEDAKFDDFLGATPPSFDQAATEEHFGDEWIPRPGQVFFRQLLSG